MKTKMNFTNLTSVFLCVCPLIDSKLRRNIVKVTLVPEAFFYSLLTKFARRTASFIFCWHEALTAEKRKPLVETVGNLTFMPSAFDRRF